MCISSRQNGGVAVAASAHRRQLQGHNNFSVLHRVYDTILNGNAQACPSAHCAGAR